LNVPIAFKVARAGGPEAGREDGVHVATAARALGGMQKEALVRFGPTGTCWRMLCDEGPYLNGTDLAPFPLAFFSTGMATSYLSEILALARQRGVRIEEIELVQDNRYGMEGSAFHGTMVGSALPVELQVRARSPAPREELLRLIQHAVAASPADALLRATLTSEFTLTRNGTAVPVTMVKPWHGEPPAAFAAPFESVAPHAPAEYAPDIIAKLEAAKTLHGVEGGAGSSLKSEQKRTLHVRATCRLREDGLKEVRVQLFQPIGSVFRFLGDDPACFGGGERAPDGLAYLSAGIAFCYLTQIGRYAHIVKQQLDSYGVIQHTHFSAPGASGGTGAPASASPVGTHVYVESPEAEEKSQMLVKMGEQTCFLHAACRTPLKTRVAVAEATNA
jgi:hypothetical protein